jgi:N6-adenosine-specific RNA methylase IME4
MGSFDQSYLSSSPVLAMQAQHPPQPAFMMGSNSLAFSSPFGDSRNPNSPSAWPNTQLKSAPSSAAGRKRSRDEAGPNLSDDEHFPVQAPIPQAPTDDEEGWEYGEGMTLIKPNRIGRAIEASSQTGTWAEEKAEEEKAKAQAQALAQAQAQAAAVLSSSAERPILRATKSQRLDLTATPSITEEVMQNGTFTIVSAPSPERTGFVEPTIDDFTRHLGIGWSLISSDEHIQAAARGWTKFIENHFPITNVKIALQSNGLESYLVEASEGYFLFGEDLKQGRLVSTNLEKVWANLRGPVPIFDGEVIMDAGETPKIHKATPPADATMMTDANMGEVDSIVNGGQQIAEPTISQAVEVEMDMS